MRASRGITLPELLVATTLALLVGAATLPATARLADSARMAAGSRYLVVRLQGLRARSIAQARAQGMLFDNDDRGWFWWEVADGNGNGLRTTEVRDGRDPVVSGPHRLSEAVPGADFGFPPASSLPALPARGGRIAQLDRPIRLGHTALLSFTPLGSCSSGTLYVTDGRRGLAAIVLYGRTGRIRVWSHDPEAGRWTL